MKLSRTARLLFAAMLIIALLASCAPREPQPPPYEGELPGRSETPPAADQAALSGVGVIAPPPELTFRNSTPRIQRVHGEVRGVWISFLEFDHMLRGRSEQQFTDSIREMYDNIADFGLNTVIVQVRPFADALYPSDYFPWSHFATGTEGVDPGFDPLAIMIDEAHARGFRFEAWLNPYRIRTAGSRVPLSECNQAQLWMDEGNCAVINYNGIISFNPACGTARELIINGVREIVRNYSVDAIHIDDYFYPTTSPGFDAASFALYQQAGGRLPLGDWRRQNVQTLLREMYAAIKEIDSRVLFGISPQSRIDYNFESLFLDVRRIAAFPGYADYIMPQIYFGFEHSTQAFAGVLEQWEAIVDPRHVGLYIGLAAYKSGLEDAWAGDGRNEWLHNTDLLRRQVEAGRTATSYRGFVIFRYDSLFAPTANVAGHVGQEYTNLRQLLVN